MKYNSAQIVIGMREPCSGKHQSQTMEMLPSAHSQHTFVGRSSSMPIHKGIEG